MQVTKRIRGPPRISTALRVASCSQPWRSTRSSLATAPFSATSSSRAFTGQWPVRSLRDLNTFPSIKNAMAHQRYLEQLSFEAHPLHPWSRMVAERIYDKRELAHNNLAGILESLSSSHQVNPWTRPQYGAPPVGSRTPLQGMAPQSPLRARHCRSSQRQSPGQQAPPSSSAGPPPVNQPFPQQFYKEPKILGQKGRNDMRK